MNIYETYRKAIASVNDQMEAAGRVPAPGQEPTFEYDEETNSYRLSILTIPRADCPHESSPVRMQIVTDGVLSSVMVCPVCHVTV